VKKAQKTLSKLVIPPLPADTCDEIGTLQVLQQTMCRRERQVATVGNGRDTEALAGNGDRLEDSKVSLER
jgi:hypothetical protein